MPDPSTFSALGWLFVALVGLVVGWNQIDDFLTRRRGNPPNEELKGDANVLLQRVAALENEAKEAMTRRRAMHAKVDEMEKAIRNEVKQDTADLHEKINKVDRDVSALSAKTELQNQQLARIESYVHRLAESRHS